MFCGERQVKERKKKGQIKVPKPYQLPSGSWRIRLQVEGQSITEATPELCIAKAKAIRAGFMESKKAENKITGAKAIEEYVKENSSVLSPSTLWRYGRIGKTGFPGYMDKPIVSVQWQQAINEEAQRVSPKTVKNEWGLIHTVMKVNGIQPPEVHLPKIVKKDLPWLTYDQIKVFLEAIKGDECELAALLALHSLRRSELCAVTRSQIKEDGIHVEGAIVQTAEGLTRKTANKTDASQRVVPIMIPRLQELVDQSQAGPDDRLVNINIQTGYDHINLICKRNGLPQVGYHGLRRSFASLGYLKAGWSERVTMKIGGWSDYKTMHNIYIKLSDKEVTEAADKMRELYENSHENRHKVEKASK
jgi:integrase